VRPALPSGLYVITDRAMCAERGLVPSVRAALRGGTVIVQYRDKSDDERGRMGEATALARLCRKSGALFLVNDDPELARRSGAHGVHVGRGDTDVLKAREILGEDALIGVSCYDSLDRARIAVAAGCDYVAFGSAFPSPTKPHAVHAPERLFRSACEELQVPVVAIGGITPENGAALISAGCRALAVISGVFGQPDPEDAARRFAALFRRAAGEDRLE
jgi:thiamine-phosphate pyrophosphorylase